MFIESPCSCDSFRRMCSGSEKQALLLSTVAGVFLICLTGCSQGNARSNDVATYSAPTLSPFLGTGNSAHCSARCVTTAIDLIRADLGLDPGTTKDFAGLSRSTLYEVLSEDSRKVGSTITRILPGDAIDALAEGPVTPIVLFDQANHIYLLIGAIQVNGQLLCQLVHGDDAVSLVTKQALTNAKFEEAWKLEKKNGISIPIHVGSAVIEINHLLHNFGEVLCDKTLEATFQLKNVSDKAVVLGAPTVSCSCVVLNITEGTILSPGETLVFKSSTKPSGATSQRNTIGLSFYEKGSGFFRNLKLTLIGSQRESMTVSPRLLDFGTVTPGSPSSRVISMHEQATDRFTLKEVDVGTLPLTYKVDVTKDKDGLATYRVHLELKETEHQISGLKEGMLRLVSDSITHPTMQIPLRYQIAPPIRTIPSVLALGTLPVGDVREQKVQFVSRDDAPMTVIIESQPDECAIHFDQSKSTEMTVKIKLKNSGIWQGVIKGQVKTSSGDQPIEIRCSGYGQT